MKPIDHIRRPWTLLVVALAAAAIAWIVFQVLGGAPEGAGTSARGGTGTPADPVEPAPLRYDDEYPAIAYSTTPPSGPIARLRERIARGELELRHSSERGYLDSLLEALDIDPASQALVFSRTSLQVGGIGPETPRAIYFNDDTYVAFVPGAEALEIASVDPNLGAVFHVLAQEPGAPDAFDQQFGRCLRCHDSLSLSGGGVPRFLLSSGYVDTRGRLVSHEGSILTSYRTPLRSRWGGWYVTGTHGEQVHLGNIAVRDASELQNLEDLRRGNLQSLEGLVDTSAYPADSSDIVALMVMQHQVDVQNAIIRAGYKTRTALAARDGGPASGARSLAELSATARETVLNEGEQLVEALLFVEEVELTDPIAGTSGFAERFERRGPQDGQSRSLRNLALDERLFEYPLSYQIYSEAFDALPAVVKDYVYGRLIEILRGRDESGRFDHLSDTDRTALLEILNDTKPAFAARLIARE